MASKSKRAAKRAARRTREAVAPTSRESALQRRADARFAAMRPERAAEEHALSEEQRAAVKSFGHKRNGTVQTHASARRVRQGALARLHRSGAISNDQLGWALEITAEHERIDAEVAIRSANLERVDGGSGIHPAFEQLGRVRREQAYGRWRDGLKDLCRGIIGGRTAAEADAPRLTAASVAAMAVLEMIVDDLGVTWAARRLGLGVRRMRKLLEDALNLWPAMLRQARDDIDEVDLFRIEARLAGYVGAGVDHP